MNKLLAFALPFSVYVSAFLLSDLLGFYLSYALRAVLTFGLICYFWKQYEIKFRFSGFAVFMGVLVIVVWLLLENQFISVEPSAFDPFESGMGYIVMAVKIFSMVVVAAVVEEIFARSFLIRFLVDPQNWDKVKMGTFRWFSFAVSVLFFGFMHSRWIQGIAAGVLFNIVYYKTKRLDACIICHAVANLILAAAAIITQNWYIW
jgi:hypothetical protein